MVGKYVEPIKQILAQSSPRYGGLRVAIGGGGHAHVDVDWPCSPEPVPIRVPSALA